MSQHIVQELRELIGSGEVSKAIKQLQSLLKGSPLYDEMILHEASKNDLFKAIRTQTLSPNEIQAEKSRLRLALIQMTNLLEEKMIESPALEAEVKKHLESRDPAKHNTINIKGDRNIGLQDISGSNVTINLPPSDTSE